MSKYTHIRIGGYDLSDDEDAELTRMQLGGYDHTIVVGGFAEDTASTVEPAARELFAGVTGTANTFESYGTKTAGDDLAFVDNSIDAADTFVDAADTFVDAADTGTDVATNDEFNLVNFAQDDAERFTLDAFGV